MAATAPDTVEAPGLEGGPATVNHDPAAAAANSSITESIKRLGGAHLQPFHLPREWSQCVELMHDAVAMARLLSPPAVPSGPSQGVSNDTPVPTEDADVRQGEVVAAASGRGLISGTHDAVGDDDAFEQQYVAPFVAYWQHLKLEADALHAAAVVAVVNR